MRSGRENNLDKSLKNVLFLGNLETLLTPRIWEMAQSFCINKIRGTGEGRKRREDNVLGIYNTLVRCFIWLLWHSGHSPKTLPYEELMRLTAGPLRDLNSRWESSYLTIKFCKIVSLLTTDFWKKMSPLHKCPLSGLKIVTIGPIVVSRWCFSVKFLRECLPSPTILSISW